MKQTNVAQKLGIDQIALGSCSGLSTEVLGVLGTEHKGARGAGHREKWCSGIECMAHGSSGHRVVLNTMLGCSARGAWNTTARSGCSIPVLGLVLGVLRTEWKVLGPEHRGVRVFDTGNSGCCIQCSGCSGTQCAVLDTEHRGARVLCAECAGCLGGAWGARDDMWCARAIARSARAMHIVLKKCVMCSGRNRGAWGAWVDAQCAQELSA